MSHGGDWAQAVKGGWWGGCRVGESLEMLWRAKESREARSELRGRAGSFQNVRQFAGASLTTLLEAQNDRRRLV